MTIQVNDVNEFTPPLLLNAIVYDVDENSANGTVIDTVASSDLDVSAVITYSLDPSTPFAIDSDSGEITVVDSSALDYETTKPFQVNVTAEDQDGKSDTRLIVIVVNDVDESASMVESVQIDDGSDQRSMVRSLEVIFSAEVTLSSGAFVLLRDDDTEIAFTASSLVTGDGKTVTTITFDALPGGSLEDGNYTLTIDRSKVLVGSTAMATGQLGTVLFVLLIAALVQNVYIGGGAFCHHWQIIRS